MIMTGELIADKYGISREEMDAFALESNNRALKATTDSLFKEEIVPVGVQQKKEKNNCR